MTPDEVYCSECVHRSKIGKNIGCLYITDTGKSRGCPPGLECDKREIGPIANRSKMFSVIDPLSRQKQKEEAAKRCEMISYKEEAHRRLQGGRRKK